MTSGCTAEEFNMEVAYILNTQRKKLLLSDKHSLVPAKTRINPQATDVKSEIGTRTEQQSQEGMILVRRLYKCTLH